MKIVQSSNYDKDDYNEQFVGPLPNTFNRAKFQDICNILNGIHSCGPDYYKVVDDDYELQKWEP